MYVPVLLIEPDAEKLTKVLSTFLLTKGLSFGRHYLIFPSEEKAGEYKLPGSTQTVLMCGDFFEPHDADPYKTLVMEVEDFIFSLTNTGKRKGG